MNNTSQNSLKTEHFKDTKDNSIRREVSNIIASILEEDLELKTTSVQQLNTIVSESPGDPNDFPTEVFPKLFRDFINDCYTSLNFPKDYTGIAVITAVATAAGTGVKVKVKKGWEAYPAIYAGLLGDPGLGKTHPVSLAFKALIEHDINNIKNFSTDFSAWQENEAVLKKDNKDNKDTIKIEKPTLVKSILHDFTPEILNQRLADNKKGCCINSDELATFFENMNQYSKGDRASGYLSIWSNQPLSIDRVSQPVPIYIQKPFLNIIGGLQPRVLPKLFPPNKTDNGFLQRFLFAYPDGAKKIAINDEELDFKIQSQYNKFINDYLVNNPICIDPETGHIQSRIFCWTNESKLFFYEWQKLNTEKVNENCNSLKGEIISKFDIHFVRLALVLQVMENTDSDFIEIKAVEGASKLCKYFLTNAFKVIDIINKPPDPKLSFSAKHLGFYQELPNNEFPISEANDIGVDFGFNTKAVQRFLITEDYFIRVSHGVYSKKKID